MVKKYLILCERQSKANAKQKYLIKLFYNYMITLSKKYRDLDIEYVGYTSENKTGVKDFIEDGDVRFSSIINLNILMNATNESTLDIYRGNQTGESMYNTLVNHTYSIVTDFIRSSNSNCSTNKLDYFGYIKDTTPYFSVDLNLSRHTTQEANIKKLVEAIIGCLNKFNNVTLLNPTTDSEKYFTLITSSIKDKQMANKVANTISKHFPDVRVFLQDPHEDDDYIKYTKESLEPYIELEVERRLSEKLLEYNIPEKD